MATFSSQDRDGDFGEDRISGLPDDIILTFLSPMEMKAAAKTSILSKRWRYLWAKRTHLEFLENNLDLDIDTASEKGKFISWVNQVVGLHCSPCIDTFRVCYPFDSCDAHHFDKWAKFALSRKVKNLELNSSSCQVVYTLGFDILKPPVMGNITSLTSLHLNKVNVSGEFIEFLLSNCPHLERLYVGFSQLLVRLKVIGGLACKLKQLTLHYCYELEELEIDAHHLMCFDYTGRSTNLVLKMPKLVEAAFGGTCLGSPVSIFQQISHLAAHISKLSLDLMYYRFPVEALSRFCNLKHVNMVVTLSESDPVDFMRLLEACPLLHELKLEFHWYIYSTMEFEHHLLEIVNMSSGDDFEVDLYSFELRPTERKTHPNLKLLQVVGFGGTYNDVEVIISIVLFAPKLETFICDPNRYIEYNDADILETSRSRAYKLVKIIPSKISLIII